MEYVYIKSKDDIWKLESAGNILKNGGIVVFPTETVYGIGTNGMDKLSVERLYKVKQRPKDKAISLMVNSMEMIQKIAKNISKEEQKIIENLLPGPLTIILKRRKEVPDIVTAGLDTVGVRMPDEKVTLKLIEFAGVPIAAPSANISGMPAGIDAKDICKEFGDKVDFYIDNGKSKIGKASTIVKVEEGKPVILREGIITLEDIEKAINS